jgi:hypothetical protein
MLKFIDYFLQAPGTTVYGRACTRDEDVSETKNKRKLSKKPFTC